MGATMPKDENPLVVALRAVFGPLVKQSSKWPPLLAYGLPGIVAVLLIVVLQPAVPNNLIWLLAVVILAPLLGYIITDVHARRSLPSDTGRGPRATIDEPRPNQTVIRTIYCNGSATSVQSNTHLWLAVEANGFVWPKEGGVYIDKDRWSASIFEDGATKKFSIALLIADPDADKFIRKWLEEGRRTGEYAEMKGIPGTERVARVDGLRLRGTNL
jgi:hypothetical protein